MFEITIETDNAAFGEDEGGAGPEVARILREVADKVENGAAGGRVFDFNGNGVGRFNLTDE